jgi:hypothetical protein
VSQMTIVVSNSELQIVSSLVVMVLVDYQFYATIAIDLNKSIYYNKREMMSYPHWLLSYYDKAFNQLDRYLAKVKAHMA